MAWLLCLPVGQASSLASSYRSTLFLAHRPKAGFRRGTKGSNPSPSSRQSVSRPDSLLNVENPVFPRGCARLAWRPGRQRRAECFDIAPTGGNISVAPYSSTAVPLMACENATPIATTRGSGLNVKQIFEFASGSSEAERDPLIVPGKRQTGVLEGASLPSSRAGGAHRGSLG
jgi:hypothetical protein